MIDSPTWIVIASAVLMTVTELFKRGVLEFAPRVHDWVVRLVPVLIAVSGVLLAPDLIPAESAGGKLIEALIAAIGSWVGWESLERRGYIDGRTLRGRQ